MLISDDSPASAGALLYSEVSYALYGVCHSTEVRGVIDTVR